MVYQGSKNKISKEIIDVIKKYLVDGWCFVEPFVGGANLGDKLDWPCKWGYDINSYLIALLKRAQQGFIEYIHLSKDEYSEIVKRVRKGDTQGLEDWFVGYVMFICSFRGLYGSGYGILKDRNGAIQRLNNLNKQASSSLFKQYHFACKNYKELVLFDCLIYLDPPYQNTTQYIRGSTFEKFNHDELVQKCKEWGRAGNVILMSEKQADPDMWEEIWSKKHWHNLLKDKGCVVEKLFLWRGKND